MLTKKKTQLFNWVTDIFHFHLLIICIFIGLCWGHLFYQKHFSLEKWQFEIMWTVERYLIWVVPIAISFAGFVRRLKFTAWVPYVIVDLTVGLLFWFWMELVLSRIFHPQGFLPFGA